MKNTIKLTVIIAVLAVCTHYSGKAFAGDIVLSIPELRSDFPNELVALQGLQLSHVYRDVYIPGDAGMDIVVTRNITEGKLRFLFPRIARGYSTGGLEPGEQTIDCLGTFEFLGVTNGERVLMPIGFSDANYAPDGADVISMFDDYSALVCEDNRPVLLQPNGRKLYFTALDPLGDGVEYIVDRIEDLFGNTINYEFEDHVGRPILRGAEGKRIKRIWRNDGAEVNFVYDEFGDNNAEYIKEINYNNKTITFDHFVPGIGRTVTDEAGRVTKFSTSYTTGVGNHMSVITLHDGTTVDYRFSPYLDDNAMSMLSAFLDAEVTYMSVSLNNLLNGAGQIGFGSGNLSSKTITEPGKPSRTIHYRITASNTWESKPIDDSGARVYSAYTFNRESSNATSRSGLLDSEKKHYGILGQGGDWVSDAAALPLVYEKSHTYQSHFKGSHYCVPEMSPAAATIKVNIDCNVYDLESTTIKLYSSLNDGNYDEFSTNYQTYNPYSGVQVKSEQGPSGLKYTKYEYYNENHWWLNRLRTESLTNGSNAYTELVRFDYSPFSSTDGSYSNVYLPSKMSIYGHERESYTDYDDKGNLQKIEYNELLKKSDGSASTSKRFIEYSNYNLGIAQTTSKPARKNETEKVHSYKVVDNNGWVTQTTDFNGNITDFGYDNIGRLTYIDPFDTNFKDTFVSWNDTNQKKKTVRQCTLNPGKTDCTGNSTLLTTIVKYNAFEQPYWTHQSDGTNNRYRVNEYNHRGQVSFSSFASSSSTESNGQSFSFDALGRIKRHSVTGGVATTYEYLDGHEVKVTDPRSNLTTTSYVSYGRPVYNQSKQIRSPHSITTTLNVDIFGLVSSITQSGAYNGVSQSLTEYRAYDEYKQLCQVKRNDVGTIVYHNNVLGEVQWQANGQTATSNTVCNQTASAAAKITFHYDNQGAINTVDYGDATPSLNYTYDNNGNVKTIGSSVFSHAYNYNSQDLLEDETLTIDNRSFLLDYGYSALGHVSGIQYPNESEQVVFSPNNFGEATQAIQGSESYVLGGANKATYYPSGAINTFTYGNGIKHKTTLNSRKFPACIRDYSSTLPACGTTQSILNLNYGYDNNANITSIADARDSGIYSLTNLTYDGLDRLRTTTGGGAIGSSNITYDSFGNIRTYSKNTGFNTHDFTYHYNNTSHTLTKVTDTGNASIKISVVHLFLIILCAKLQVIRSPVL